MSKKKYARRLIVAGMMLVALALTACSAATPMPTPTVAPQINQLALIQASTSTPQPSATATSAPTNTSTPTLTPTPTDTPTPTTTPTLVATSTPMPTPTPSGASPESAREPNGSWGYIEGNSKIWFGVTDSRMKLEIWLDAHRQKGISMLIYAPDQKDLWIAKPVGRGTANSLQPEHDLFWAGKTAAFGKWYVLVQNDNSFPVNFSINFDRVATRVADRCAVCHGYDITFDGCDDGGSDWCEGLEEEFQH